MAKQASLGQAAYERQVVYYNDPTLSWEQRLAAAHDEALRYVSSIVEPGSDVDLAAYELNADLGGSQLAQQAEMWLSNFRDNRPADEATGIRFSEQSAYDYYLGQFAQASANIGVFLTGYAREQIAIGGLTENEFNQSCEMRLRAFSDIIYLGKTGIRGRLGTGCKFLRFSPAVFC